MLDFIQKMELVFSLAHFFIKKKVEYRQASSKRILR